MYPTQRSNRNNLLVLRHGLGAVRPWPRTHLGLLRATATRRGEPVNVHVWPSHVVLDVKRNRRRHRTCHLLLDELLPRRVGPRGVDRHGRLALVLGRHFAFVDVSYQMPEGPLTLPNGFAVLRRKVHGVARALELVGASTYAVLRRHLLEVAVRQTERARCCADGFGVERTLQHILRSRREDTEVLLARDVLVHEACSLRARDDRAVDVPLLEAQRGVGAGRAQLTRRGVLRGARGRDARHLTDALPMIGTDVESVHETAHVVVGVGKHRTAGVRVHGREVLGARTVGAVAHELLTNKLTF
eukprot:PhM_4_TR11963/c0_g2_i1/m.30969